MPGLTRKKDEALHVVIDSCEMKVYGEGEWKVRQHVLTIGQKCIKMNGRRQQYYHRRRLRRSDA